MSKTDMLRDCGLFAGFTDVGLTILAGIASEKRLRTNTPIFVEGMIGESLFILVSGEVGVYVRDGLGREREVSKIRPSEAFGELALLGEGPRLVTTKTTADSFVLEIQRKDFVRLKAKKPQACLKLLMSIVRSFGEQMNENRDALKSVLLAASAEVA